MVGIWNECDMLLALRALQSDPKLSVRHAAQIYNIPHRTLQRRKDGQTARAITRSPT